MKECARYILQLSRGHRTGLILAIVLGVVNVCLGLCFIWVSKGVVDVATSHDATAFWPMVALMAGIMVLRLVLMSVRQYVIQHTNIRLVNSIRQRLFQDVMGSPWQGREGMAVGDVMSRLGEDLRVVTSCLTSDLPSLILSVCQFLAASWFLFVLQPSLLWALLALTPVAIVLSKAFYKVTRHLTLQIREEEADITSHMQESLLNRPMLISLQCIPLMVQRLIDRQHQLLDTYQHRIRFTIQTRLFIHFTFMAGYTLSFVWGAHGIMLGTVTYGMMTAFLQLVAQVQHPILNMSELLPQFVQATTAAERLRELRSVRSEELGVRSEELGVRSNSPSCINAGEANNSSAFCEAKALTPNSSLLTPHSSLNDVVVTHVFYRYPDGERYILSDLSLTFPSGSTTAIVGPTGSGKSTLVRLLLGLIKPVSGTIDLANQRIAYVPQGNSLLRGTIRDNLLLGKLDATDDELREALRRASALFVYDLPDGLDTPCGEKGSGLSEGQAQRLAIARALLQPGTVMILDEASSALDPATERQILEEIQQTQMGKTLIWVTHHDAVRDYMQRVVEIG